MAPHPLSVQNISGASRWRPLVPIRPMGQALNVVWNVVVLAEVYTQRPRCSTISLADCRVYCAPKDALRVLDVASNRPQDTLEVIDLLVLGLHRVGLSEARPLELPERRLGG